MRQSNREGLKRKRMVYQLVPASIEDETWLERLRRAVYQELFMATSGGWDEARHARQFDECLNRGGISIIEVDGAPVGMIQLFDQPDAVEVGEIQIQPSHQNQGIGSRVLKDTIARVHEQRKKVLLSVALKNERAYQLYQRLGFQKVGHNDTHNLMAYDPQR
jgi:ribosomal protein S18 acetylase RimI-like enzyme